MHAPCRTQQITGLTAAAVAGLVCALATSEASAQRDRKPADLAAAAARDPYTGNDKGRMAALGYASFGPFAWDQEDSTTATVSAALGEPRIRWIETAHFKLGCDLAPRRIPTVREHRSRLRADLRELKKRLPGVRTNVTKLDRWLLAHVFALRLESLYAEFSKLLGVTDADFPAADAPGGDHYMGEGAFLGQRAKFCVILFDRQTQLMRYLQRFTEYRGRQALPVRSDFAHIGSLAFATASECHGGMLFDDAAMHQHVVCEVVKNLAAGYKSNLFTLPTWWSEGLGHWFGRKLHPDIVLMDERVDPNQFHPRGRNWEARVLARVKHSHYPDTAALFARHDYTVWTVQDHMMAWSRFAYLAERHPDGVRRFLDYCNDLKVPIRDFNRPEARKYQIEALQRACALDFAGFDASWKKHVLTRYR